MKLKDYATMISKLAKRYPNLEVVYAVDDEGNAYHPVVYAPSVMTVGVGYDEKEETVLCLN